VGPASRAARVSGPRTRQRGPGPTPGPPLILPFYYLVQVASRVQVASLVQVASRVQVASGVIDFLASMPVFLPHLVPGPVWGRPSSTDHRFSLAVIH
jgi:hypothetical protein